MPKPKRYIGRLTVTDFIHPRTKRQTKRAHIHLPIEILEDERLDLENGDELLISLEEDIITLEKI